jgi:hypothetical protein
VELLFIVRYCTLSLHADTANSAVRQRYCTQLAQRSVAAKFILPQWKDMVALVSRVV